MGIISDIHEDLDKGAVLMMAEYRARLQAEAVRLCGDLSSSEDLVCRTLEQAIRKIDTYREDRNLFGWMRTIMQNLHRNDGLRAVNRGTEPVDAETLERYAGEDNSTDEQILRQADHDALREAIEQLDPKYKQAVLLHYFSDFSIKEIAAILRAPMGTVSRRLQIARRILAAKLADKLGKKRPLAIVAALFLTAGALFGAWQAGVGAWLAPSDEPAADDGLSPVVKMVDFQNEKESNKMKLTPMKSMAVAATAATMSLASFATVRHVDYANGADSGDGTAAPGWKTLAYAVGQANEGDVIILAAGDHQLSADVTVDKILTITGAGAVIKGKKIGYLNWAKVNLAVDGIKLHSLTMFKGFVNMTGASTVSNVVFTTGGETVDDNGHAFAVAAAGLITGCCFTNNVNYTEAGLSVSGSAVVENCVLVGNRTTVSNSGRYGRVLTVKPGSDANVVIRNCTIVDNTFQYGGGASQANCTAVYVAGTPANAKFYNNIIWNNRNSLDEELNYNTNAGAGKYNGWVANCVSPADVLPAENGNFCEDPKLLVDRMHLASDSPCRGNAWTGLDADGVAYAPSIDFFGEARGAVASVGAVEYVEVKIPMVVTAVAPEVGRVLSPGTLPFSCTVEGDYVEPLEYYWNFDGEGKVTADTASVDLGVPGAYHNPTLTVTDAEGQEKTVTVEGVFKVIVLSDETRYVDSAGGNDGNDGTAPDRAWKTLAHAVEASDEGYTIVLLPGEHPLSADVTVDKILTITGAGAVIKGKKIGYLNWAKVNLAVDGIKLHSLTMFKGFVNMTGASTVSNVVFTTGGETVDDNGHAFAVASAGLITGCCFTNNVNYTEAGLSVSGSAVVENCVLVGNRTTVSNSGNVGRVLTVQPDISSCVTVRNCTIVDNAFYYEDVPGKANCPAVCVTGIPGNARIYNNIIWNNRNSIEEVKNYNAGVRAEDYVEWICNCTMPTTVLPADCGNIDLAPVFKGGDPFAPAYESPCRNAGNDDLAPKGVDFFGNPRKVSRHVDIGAVEDQLCMGFGVLVR